MYKEQITKNDIFNMVRDPKEIDEILDYLWNASIDDPPLEGQLLLGDCFARFPVPLKQEFAFYYAFCVGVGAVEFRSKWKNGRRLIVPDQYKDEDFNKAPMLNFACNAFIFRNDDYSPINFMHGPIPDIPNEVFILEKGPGFWGHLHDVHEWAGHYSYNFIQIKVMSESEKREKQKVRYNLTKDLDCREHYINFGKHHVILDHHWADYDEAIFDDPKLEVLRKLRFEGNKLRPIRKRGLYPLEEIYHNNEYNTKVWENMNGDSLLK